MNHELQLALNPVIFLSFCSGILFIGTLLYLYVYFTSKKVLYLSISIIGLLGSLSIIFEAGVIGSGILGKAYQGYLFHRLQALTLTCFIPTLPLFVYNLTHGVGVQKFIIKSMIYSGTVFTLVTITAGFCMPDLFLAPKSSTQVSTHLWNIGRGNAQLLYQIRDIIIALWALICALFLARELFSKKRAPYILFTFIGAMIAITSGIADMLFAVHERNLEGLFTIRVISVFSVGVTIFIILSMIGVMKLFIDQTRSIDKAVKLESLGILAGGIAHDFNNTLAHIVGNISLLKFTNLTDREQNKVFHEIESVAFKARRLTEQLLTFSKGGGPVKKITSTKNLIEEVVHFLLVGSGIQSKFIFTDTLWNIDVDQGQITQVLQNIIINAKQALKDKGLISIECANLTAFVNPLFKREVSDYVKISISDDGPGIKSKLLKNIFDPYFSTKPQGNGLGLSICYSIIENHHGYIEVHSELGEGTTFSIYLPATQKKVINEENPEISSTHQFYRALILEDEPGIQSVLTRMLKLINIEATITATGEETLKIFKDNLKETAFDFLLMDLTIVGGMGGAETAHEILKIAPNTKMIVSSGYSQDQVMANYKQYGFCNVIQKPYRMEEFKTIIYEVINEKS